MRSTNKKLLALSAMLCSFAMAQSPPSKQGIRTVITPKATLILDGNLVIGKTTAAGVVRYIYENGLPVRALHSDGTFASYKFSNGKMQSITYSDGTVKQAGEKTSPTVGGSIAARGGAIPMKYGSNWDDDFGDADHWWLADDRGGRGDNSYGNWDWGVSGTPIGSFPGDSPDRMLCMAGANRAWHIMDETICGKVADPVNKRKCMEVNISLYMDEIAYCRSQFP